MDPSPPLLKMPQLTIDVEEWRKRRQQADKAAKEASKELVVDVDMMDKGAAANKLEDMRMARLMVEFGRRESWSC